MKAEPEALVLLLVFGLCTFVVFHLSVKRIPAKPKAVACRGRSRGRAAWVLLLERQYTQRAHL